MGKIIVAGHAIASSNAPLRLNLHLPHPGTDNLERFVWAGADVSVNELLLNDVDADGDLLEIDSVALQSIAGGFVTLRNGRVIYKPPPGFTGPDGFTYLVTDGGFLVNGMVMVGVRPEQPHSDVTFIEVMETGHYRLGFAGVPGLSYRVEHTQELFPPDWMTLTNSVANAEGFFECVNALSGESNTRYYRAVWP